jgi:uncharacterized membrane protein
MQDINQKLFGAVLIGLALILMFVLIFVKIQSDKEGAFLCQIVAESPDMSMADCPAHNSSNSWLIMVAFGVAFLMLGAGAYLSLQGPKERRTKKLDEEEQRIVEILKQREGSMYQSDLMKELDYTKVRMTRTLDKMESKHILERKRRGMTNIIVLK